MPKRKLSGVGWREWVFLPSLCESKINAKIDTGASTSALHAEEISFFTRDGVKMVKFKVFPNQRSRVGWSWVEAEYVEKRKIRSSVGTETLRPVIKTQIALGEDRFETEVTLVNRGMMGFRMLLGRSALKRRYWVNPGASYLATRSLNRKIKK